MIKCNIFRFAALFLMSGIIMLILFSACSCVKSAQNSTKTKEHEISVRDSSKDERSRIELRTVYDSMYVHDSVLVTTKGDTVIVTNWRTKYVERVKCRELVDTVYLYSERERKEKEMEKEMDKKKISSHSDTYLTFFFFIILMIVVYINTKTRK